MSGKKSYKPPPWKHIKMAVRTPEEAEGMPILAREGGDGLIFDGPDHIRVTHDCGACGYALAKGWRPAQFEQVFMRCRCGTINETVGG